MKISLKTLEVAFELINIRQMEIEILERNGLLSPSQQKYYNELENARLEIIKSIAEPEHEK
jgi:hypothetical protein